MALKKTIDKPAGVFGMAMRLLLYMLIGTVVCGVMVLCLLMFLKSVVYEIWFVQGLSLLCYTGFLYFAVNKHGVMDGKLEKHENIKSSPLKGLYAGLIAFIVLAVLTGIMTAMRVYAGTEAYTALGQGNGLLKLIQRYTSFFKLAFGQFFVINGYVTGGGAHVRDIPMWGLIVFWLESAYVILVPALAYRAGQKSVLSSSGSSNMNNRTIS